MLKRLRSGPARERGQSMTELALSMTAILFVVVGVLDLGRMYMTYLALQNAAGEGALYGSIHPRWVSWPDQACDPSEFGCTNPVTQNVTWRVRNEAPLGALVNWYDDTKTHITVALPGGNDYGQPFVVTITYDYEFFTPFLSRIWPQITLTGNAQEPILGH